MTERLVKVTKYFISRQVFFEKINKKAEAVSYLIEILNFTNKYILCNF
jgi:hypothetical protein